MLRNKIKKPAFRIRHKIILMIYLVLFPVLIVTSGILFYNGYTMTSKEALSQYNSVIQTVGDNIESIERDVTDISIYFSINAEIHDLLTGPSATIANDPLFWTKQAPMDIMKDIFAIKSHMRTIILYPENGLSPFFVSHDASVHDTDINNIRLLPLYARASEARGSSVIERVNAGETGLFIRNRSDKVVFARALFDLSKKRQLGFLIISIDVSWYERICHNALLRNNEAIFIMSPDDVELARAGNIDDDTVRSIVAGAYSPAKNHTPPRCGDWYIFSSDARPDGKTIFYLSPVANWSSWVSGGVMLPVTLAVALLFCVWPISSMASGIMARPLNRLYVSMNKFKEGDFSQQVEVTGSDEIAELSVEFNRMVSDLRELIERNYVMALRERESELNALQAQINPHFLYNSLDSLYWQATDSGHEKLAEDILSMSALFRLLLSSGESCVAVEQELHLITHYLHIQKMRFSKKLDYAIDVDEELLTKSIPKLILQPFVENAVVHGLEKIDTWGYVNVTGKLENDRMVFTIKDNGAGMPRETLNEIFSADSRYANQRIGSFAIRNVKERMSLKYGEDCKLEIESGPGEGCTVTISLPADTG